MKFVSISNGGVVTGAITPKSQWIDQAANRSFVGEGHVEVNETISDGELLNKKYDSSAESDDVKTLDSFEDPGVDSNGFARWFDWETGVKYQNTYDENGLITGQEQV